MIRRIASPRWGWATVAFAVAVVTTALSISRMDWIGAVVCGAVWLIVAVFWAAGALSQSDRNRNGDRRGA
jgi:hypothetical protein